MRLIYGLLIALVFAVSAPAQTSDGAGIENTIQSQIDAFLADNFEEAFSYASPNIQGLFGSSERFGLMVRNGYPMVWRPSNVEYLDQTERGGALFQKVLIRDAQGTLHLLEYQMVRSDGTWRINGVQLLQPPGVGA